MKNHLLNLTACFLFIFVLSSTAQTTDTTNYNYGIWQTFSNPVPKLVAPELQGRLCNFRWADIEVAPNVWNWSAFDNDLAARAKDSLPIIFMVYTKEDAPDWLFTNGVPKVIEKDASGNITGYAPYYNDTAYKRYFKRMITTVRRHLETLPDSVHNKIIGVQACFGNTGDYIGYKGNVDPQYQITASGFFSLFKEFSQYYYNEYQNSNPKIHLLSNPKNNGVDQLNWVIANLPGSWVKCGLLGKGYQLNDEVTKAGWLYPIINSPQSGNYIRARSEIIGNGLSSGWWLESPYKNMFALLCYDIYWGLDWSNQSIEQLNDPLFDSAFSFFNKYAGQKDPAKATNAMCALRDGLDASDAIRFPSAIFGNISKTAFRFNKVLQPFVSYGAKLEDVSNAVLTETENLTANGINDVGWRIFAGNYDRYIHQINANATSAGYWNVQSADVNSMYGRFARGFDLANGKDALYFDVDSAFLRNTPVDGQYPVMIEITYLDKGAGAFQLFYDAKNNGNKSSVVVTCNNTNLWKKATIALRDAYFGNRSINSSDFYIKNVGNSNVIFSVIELSRPGANSGYVGYNVSSSVSFDTVCVNSVSAPKTFTLAGSFLSDSTTTIGPLHGFVFSTSSDGPYTDSIILNGYGASFYQNIYLKFQPDSAGVYNGNIPVYGGGVNPASVHVKGIAIDSRPIVNANVTNVSCNNAKDGAIDLTLNGGIGPFTYSWSNVNNANAGNEDLNGLAPGIYNVTIGSKTGCVAFASYTITQPDSLIATLSADSMICKGGTTTVYVNATGGTLPYSGTGAFTVSAGVNVFTVTDSKGCADRETITISNGTLTPPAKPTAINNASADVMGVCKGGNFNFAVDPVETASSFAWKLPNGTQIISANNDSSQISVNIPVDFIADSISVFAKNVCGSSAPRIKDIYTIPAKPQGITGSVSVMPSQAGVVYSVVQPVDGLNYVWFVPPGAAITSGQNTATITVTWSTNGGNVVVKAVNSCGTSAGYSLNVAVTARVFVTSVSTLVFDTVCVNGMSKAQSFNLSASGLDATNVTVGPVPGFKFSSALNGVYSNTLVISNYGTSINRSVFVMFNPFETGAFNNSIPINGGGGIPAFVDVQAFAVNSSPELSAIISNVSCKGAKDGAIDLSITGGTGPFKYFWVGSGSYDSSLQDITGLTASNYTVSVTSYAGCIATATYTITQPDALTVKLLADTIICKGGTTTVHVTATGGTMPYTGIGDFMGVGSGASYYTVTDAHNCAVTKTIYIPNGTLTAPAKPAGVTGMSDATGLCGGGSFDFSIASVPNASYYTWAASDGCKIASTNSEGTRITLNVPAAFTSGMLSVSAGNACGTSKAASDALSNLPAKPGSITGTSTVFINQKGIVYSVPAVAGLTYKWILPAGAKVTSGLNTNSITVDWGSNSGYIYCKAVNACGISIASFLYVNVNMPIKNSNTQAITFGAPLKATIMPNPAKTETYVVMSSGEPQKYSVTITSITGKLLQQKNVIALKGENMISLDVHNYTNGIYMVTIINEKGERNTLKLVKE